MSRPKMFKLTGEVTDTMRAAGIKKTDMIEMLTQSAPYRDAHWNRRFENVLFRVGDDGTVFEFYRGPKVIEKKKPNTRSRDTELLRRALTMLEKKLDGAALLVLRDDDYADYETLLDDLDRRVNEKKET